MSGLFPGDVFPADLEIQHLPPGSKPVAYAASKGQSKLLRTHETSITDPWCLEFEGRKVVLVSFPGAFTGPCSQTHLPGFVANMDKFRASGIDKIAIVAYNDAYVMNAWKKDHGITGDFMVRGSIDILAGFGH